MLQLDARAQYWKACAVFFMLDKFFTFPKLWSFWEQAMQFLEHALPAFATA